VNAVSTEERTGHRVGFVKHARHRKPARAKLVTADKLAAGAPSGPAIRPAQIAAYASVFLHSWMINSAPVAKRWRPSRSPVVASDVTVADPREGY